MGRAPRGAALRPGIQKGNSQVKMKKRLLGVFAFALAVSAGAAFVLYQLIASKVKVGASTAPATTKVLVAAHNLDLGALIQEKDLRLQDYLTPPAGAITKKEDIIGRGVANPIHEESPFFEASLAPKGAGAGFAATIPKGMRAFPVHVNEVVGVSGFAVVGMRVDVLVSGTPTGAAGAENGGPITRTLLQNVQILSAGQNFQKDAEGKPVLVQVVNLLVSPEQAEILNLATEQRIQLVLRNPTDQAVVSTPGASQFNVFSGGVARPVTRLPVGAVRVARRAAPVEAPAAKPRTVTVQVFAGDKKTESTFENPDAEPRP
jgi:pilus assembly protein CpaB